eukprot:1342989-Amorphochlora_amoeboformis.AAC.3
MVPELPKKDSLRLKSIEVKSSPPEAFDLSDNLGSSDMDTGIAPQKPQCIIHHDAWYYLTCGFRDIGSANPDYHGVLSRPGEHCRAAGCTLHHHILQNLLPRFCVPLSQYAEPMRTL